MVFLTVFLDEAWRDNARDVVAAFGFERKPTVPKINASNWGIWTTPQIYRRASWNLNADGFTAYPVNALSSVLIMQDDEIFQKNIWCCDGKPF